MKRASVVIAIGFTVLAVLHQDEWNWDNGGLVFGFLPVGLAYHAGYSILAATFWALVIRFAWPHKLEAWADGEDGGDS
jgi:hypothetical protein